MDNVCRTCLGECQNPISLFQDYKLLYKIQEISNVVIVEEDELPSDVCSDCENHINFCFKFIKQIINNDKALHNLKKQNKLEEKDCLASENAEIIIINENLCEKISIEKKNNYENLVAKEIKIEPPDSDSETDTIFDDAVKNVQVKMESDDEDNRQRKRKHCKIRLKQCKMCSFKTYDSKKLKHHYTTHKPKRPCNICGKFYRSENLSKHVKIHSDNNAITCHVCGKLFKNEESFRSHPMMHVKEDSICEKCGKQFEYKGEYLRHLRVHRERIRKVTCEICKKLFVNQGDLRNHMRRHTGERPYPCDICLKRFSSGWALKTHMRQHTKEKPFQCELCSMAFAQKVSLRTHMRSKHELDLTW